MARKKEYKNINIDVEPFLSIMAIVLKLISLILVVIVMRIAVNPKAIKAIALKGLYEGKGNLGKPKSPAYIDCFPEKLVLYADKTILPTYRVEIFLEDLKKPGNALEKMLEGVQERKETDYIVVMARPGSAKLFRQARNLLKDRPIDVGYDAVDADFDVKWDEARKALGVATD